MLEAGIKSITVVGDCTENLEIRQDDIVLNGSGSATLTGNGSSPAITITGNRVVIEDWAGIHGGTKTGILVGESGSATISNVDSITGSDGVMVTQSAFMRVEYSDIQATDDGIVATQGGNAYVTHSDSSFNGGDGAVVVGGGSAEFGTGNTINSNGRDGIIFSGGNAYFSGGSSETQSNNTSSDPLGYDIVCVAYSRVLVYDDSRINSTTKGLNQSCVMLTYPTTGLSIWAP